MMLISMAWRNLWRNKLRSIVILISVSLGLLAGMAVLSLYNGMMENRVRTVIEEETGHLQIHNPSFPADNDIRFFIPQADELKRSLTSGKEILHVTMRTVAQGMLSTTTGSSGVQIMGIIPEDENKISGLKQKIKEGNGFSEKKRSQIILGRKLAQKLKLHIGSKLVLTMNDSSNQIVAGAFRICGIYQSANAQLDERIVYVKKEELNDLLSMPEATHEIAIILEKDGIEEKIQQKIYAGHTSLLIQTWKELSPETDLLIKTVDRYSVIILVIVFLALAFGIINTMLMAILERTREIGMMMALGTSRIRLFGMVITETLFLTLAGTPPGLLVSWLTISYFHQQGLDLSSMGEELMSSFGFRTTIYPVFPSEKMIMVFLVVSCTAIFSGLFPALRALRMNPSEALRH